MDKCLDFLLCYPGLEKLNFVQAENNDGFWISVFCGWRSAFQGQLGNQMRGGVAGRAKRPSLRRALEGA